MRKQTVEQYQRISIQDIQKYLLGMNPEIHSKENPLSLILSVGLFSVSLIATRCNYGGYRWGLICPKTCKKCLYCIFLLQMVLSTCVLCIFVFRVSISSSRKRVCFMIRLVLDSFCEV